MYLYADTKNQFSCSFVEKAIGENKDSNVFRKIKLIKIVTCMSELVLLRCQLL